MKRHSPFNAYHISFTLIPFLLTCMVFFGCDSQESKSNIQVREPFAALHEQTEKQEPLPDSCCRIESDLEGLDIFINGIRTGYATPKYIPLETGDFVHLSTIVEPGVDVLLVTQGNQVQTGAWVVQGEEKVIRFGKERFREGLLSLVKTGPGWSTIGLDLNKPLSSERFADLVKGTIPLHVLYIDMRKGLSLSAMKAVTTVWALDISSTDVSDLTGLEQNHQLRMLTANDSDIRDLTPLKGFSKLVALDIDNTRVRSLAPLSSSVELRVLHLRNTPIADISPIASASKLEYLDCTSTGISDLAPLKNMKNLKALLIGSTKVANLAPLSNNTMLSELTLSDTSVSDLTPLRNLISLSSIHLRRTRISNVEAISGMTKLTELYMDGSSVEEISPLAQLQSLKKLSLAKTKVKDVKALAGLAGLTWLSLRGTDVPDGQVKMLQKALPDCKIISGD